MASVETELEQEVERLRPKTRYQDLAIWFRRLRVEADHDLPGDADFVAKDGTVIRVRRHGEAVAVGGDPPGSTVHLQDGEELSGAHGNARLRVEVLKKFGGRWDHREKRFTATAPREPLIIDVQESQVETVRWFASRWDAFKLGRRHPKTIAMLLDDRGGGKTWIILMLWLGATIDFPKHPDGAEFVPWIVTVTYPARKEIDREIRRWLPESWYRIREWPLHELHLINGGAVSLMSADDPNVLRQGRVDALWFNEGALMPSASIENAIGRLKDRKGFAVVTTNPPTPECPRGEWVQELYEKATEADEAGERNPVVFLRCSSKLNVLQSADAAADVATVLEWLNPAKAKADADGLLMPMGEYAYRPPYNHRRHIVKLVESDWAKRDVTRQVTARNCGHAYDWIFGADFQSRPAMVATASKVYDTPERPTIVVWSCFWVEGDEDDLITAVENDMEWCELFRGQSPRFTRDNTVFIGDPSGTWQDGEHNPGKDSFAPFRARQWRILPPMKPRTPDKKPPHPPVTLRVARMNGLLAEDRLLIADNPTTEPLQHSLHKCPLVKQGFRKIPKPGDKSTHLPDALGYEVWWIIPRYQQPGGAMARPRSLGSNWRNR